MPINYFRIGAHFFPSLSVTFFPPHLHCDSFALIPVLRQLQLLRRRGRGQHEVHHTRPAALPTVDEASVREQAAPRLAASTVGKGMGKGGAATATLLTAPPPTAGDDEGRQGVTAWGGGGEGGRKKGHNG